MYDISIPIEEVITDLLLETFGYKIEPWEAEEVAHKIVEEMNERLSFAIE